VSNVTTVTVAPNGTLTYSPKDVTVTQGATVHWVWSDTSNAHTVTSGANGIADGMFCSITDGSPVNAQTCTSTSYARTAPFTYDHVFDQAGTFPYYDAVVGPGMSGSVTVTPVATTTSPPPQQQPQPQPQPQPMQPAPQPQPRPY
jgi:plastocyanin